MVLVWRIVDDSPNSSNFPPAKLSRYTVHTHIHTHIYTHTYTHIHVYTHTYTHTHTHIYTQFIDTYIRNSITLNGLLFIDCLDWTEIRELVRLSGHSFTYSILVTGGLCRSSTNGTLYCGLFTSLMSNTTNPSLHNTKSD